MPTLVVAIGLRPDMQGVRLSEAAVVGAQPCGAACSVRMPLVLVSLRT